MMDYDTYVTACYHEGVKPVSREEYYQVNKPPQPDADEEGSDTR